MERLKPCPFCGCGDRRVGIRRMGNNGYRICCSKCGSLGPHVSVKEWNGQKELAQKEAREKWNVCAAAGEDVDELPEQVFISVSEKLEDRMLENNGDLEYSVVQEVVNEFWEQEAEEEDADCKSE